MERGGYLPTGYKIDPIVLNAGLPLEFYEARNAMRIAKSEGAEQYADESYGHALKLMDNADQYAIDRHHHNKQLIAISREVVQTAEDARTIAVKRMDEARNHEERRQLDNALVIRKPKQPMQRAVLNAPMPMRPMRNPMPLSPITRLNNLKSTTQVYGSREITSARLPQKPKPRRRRKSTPPHAKGTKQWLIRQARK